MTDMVSGQNLFNIFFDIFNRASLTYDQLQSSPISTPRAIQGYVHTLTKGNAILINADDRPYLIPEHCVRDHQLNTGDYIDAFTGFAMEYSNVVVTHIKDVTRINYDRAPVIKPTRSFDFEQHKIKLGTTALVRIDDQTDVAERVDQIVAQVPDDIEKVFLSFDGREINFDPAYTLFATKPWQSSRDKLMVCLMDFFRVKEMAANGKDVVLIIDSLDKMFTVFNNCMQYNTGIIEPENLSEAAATDLENILCSTANLKDGGSFTIMGLHREIDTYVQKYITMRFHQIFDIII